jgi:hypothetical protein
MYKGTFILDLMATVEQGELRAEQRRMAEQQELRAIFAMEIPLTNEDRILMGAA